jgi:MFS family permease
MAPCASHRGAYFGYIAKRSQRPPAALARRPTTMKTTKTPRLHYAWIVLGTACVLSIAARADSASFAVFVDPLVKLFGWKRGEISFAYSLAFLFGLPATIAMGWLGDRYGARPLMIVARSSYR